MSVCVCICWRQETEEKCFPETPSFAHNWCLPSPALQPHACRHQLESHFGFSHAARILLLTPAPFPPQFHPPVLFPVLPVPTNPNSAQSALLLVSAVHPHHLPPMSNSIKFLDVKSGIPSGKEIHNSLLIKTWKSRNLVIRAR